MDYDDREILNKQNNRKILAIVITTLIICSAKVTVFTKTISNRKYESIKIEFKNPISFKIVKQ